jgi:hypothetical protein
MPNTRFAAISLVEKFCHFKDVRLTHFGVQEMEENKAYMSLIAKKLKKSNKSLKGV